MSLRRHLLVVFALALPAAAAAQTPDLAFHGFEAGAHLGDIADRVRELDGARLRCDRSRSDRRVLECRATLVDPELGRPIRLWLSTIDSVAGVLTLSSNVESDELDEWRSTLERRYGRVGAQVQGPQWMMQWVRRGRMLRLTWRVQGKEKVASVSLVDGRVLDGWGRDRATRRAETGGR